LIAGQPGAKRRDGPIQGPQTFADAQTVCGPAAAVRASLPTCSTISNSNPAPAGPRPALRTRPNHRRGPAPPRGPRLYRPPNPPSTQSVVRLGGVGYQAGIKRNGAQR